MYTKLTTTLAGRWMNGLLTQCTDRFDNVSTGVTSWLAWISNEKSLHCTWATWPRHASFDHSLIAAYSSRFHPLLSTNSFDDIILASVLCHIPFPQKRVNKPRAYTYRRTFIFHSFGLSCTLFTLFFIIEIQLLCTNKFHWHDWFVTGLKNAD